MEEFNIPPKSTLSKFLRNLETMETLKNTEIYIDINLESGLINENEYLEKLESEIHKFIHTIKYDKANVKQNVALQVNTNIGTIQSETSENITTKVALPNINLYQSLQIKRDESLDNTNEYPTIKEQNRILEECLTKTYQTILNTGEDIFLIKKHKLASVYKNMEKTLIEWEREKNNKIRELDVKLLNDKIIGINT